MNKEDLDAYKSYLNEQVSSKIGNLSDYISVKIGLRVIQDGVIRSKKSIIPHTEQTTTSQLLDRIAATFEQMFPNINEAMFDSQKPIQVKLNLFITRVRAINL